MLRGLERVLAQGEWCSLDTETTGLGPQAEIVEVGIVGPAGSYSTRVRPQDSPSSEAVAVHGLDGAALAGAPSFPAIATEVRRRLAGRDVLAYPAPFDRRLLWREFARAGQPAPRCRWHCVADAAMALTGRRQRLREVAEELGLPLPSVAHRALPDAALLVEVAKALVREATA